jgi:hypothetical protein
MEAQRLLGVVLVTESGRAATGDCQTVSTELLGADMSLGCNSTPNSSFDIDIVT